MKPISSLYTKILLWLLLNMALVAILLGVFFAFQSQLDLNSLFRKQAYDRMRIAGRLISRDLHQTPKKKWPEILAHHAEIHQVAFVVIQKNGYIATSQQIEPPDEIKVMAIKELRRHGNFGKGNKPRMHDANGFFPDRNPNQFHARKKIRLIRRTKNPTRYWIGIPIPIIPMATRPASPAILFAVSDSITGNGFFFDPSQWIFVVVFVLLISVIFWIPLVRNITKPLARMTSAAEKIAKGKFDLFLDEQRQDEIGRLSDAINNMTSRLSGYVKGQKRFLGDVAHELGSPIARIQFGLAALEQRVNNENRNRVIDVIEDVQHMSSLVNELLSFSRAEMRPEKVKLETILLLPLIEQTIEREKTSDVQIVNQVNPELKALAAPGLLSRSLANLIRNAIRYAGYAGPINIIAKEHLKTISIEIQDAGPGVSQEMLDQIFEPFFRPEPSRDRESGGVGLGLTIVKTCIETCRGTVAAKNLTPKGFSVTITLPKKV